MALVRVYCGLASADLNATPPGSETWLTLAVVDDAGRLLDICDISDDASGYAELGSLLAERSNGLESVAVAADSDEHIVTRLLIAAGRFLAYTDEDSAEDYAERFSDNDSSEEVDASPAERRAVGLARALQAGVLSAVPQPTPRDLLALKPVLSAHAAVTNGRQNAAATLREVLRELYPAALRAFPDPAEPIPLAILDALPEPGPLGSNANGRGRDAQAIAELAESGVADSATLTEAVAALRVAVAETPRRTGMNRSITSAVAETVRQSVAAVRACDAGATALVSVLAARMPKASAPASQPIRTRPAAAASGARAAAPAATQAAAPAATQAAAPAATQAAAPAAAQPTPAAQTAQSTPAAQPTQATQATPATRTAPAGAASTGVHRAPTETPIVSPPTRTRAARRAAENQTEEHVAGQSPIPAKAPVAPRAAAPAHPAAQSRPEPAAAAAQQTPPVAPPGLSSPYPTGPLRPPAAEPFAASLGVTESAPAADRQTRPAAHVPPPGSRARWPLAGESAAEAEPRILGAPESRAADGPRSEEPSRAEMPRLGFSHALGGPAAEPPATDLPQREGRVVPPWQSDDLPAEPPALRLVEQRQLAKPALTTEPPQYREEVSARLRAEPPSLRLVEAGGLSSALSENVNEPPDRSGSHSADAEPPAKDEADGDLLIFAEARSAWFTDHFGEDDIKLEFSNASDEGWRAARHAAEPAVGSETNSGLPRRVPQQNLVPGSPIGAPERPLRVVRDPAAIAAHTSGYFRGWRRGQEVGGYRVGGRPGRESAGWDFSRDRGDDERDYEYRSARS